MKYIIWNFLVWIDNDINHTIIDWFFDIDFFHKDNKLDKFMYWLWKHTSRAFCNWVILDLEDAGWDKK